MVAEDLMAGYRENSNFPFYKSVQNVGTPTPKGGV